MLAISVELLHSTFRGDPNGTANTGQLSRGEWPPSPLRLFSALVAADGSRKNCWATNGSELRWLEQLPPPVIYADSKPLHQIIASRYVVRYRHTGVQKNIKCQQEYINRGSALVRPGVRVSPRDPHVVYFWDVEPPNPSIFNALLRRAARVGYLGASDSPVRIRVSIDKPPVSDTATVFVPDKSGDIVINVAKSGDLEILDRLYDFWCKEGASVSRSQFPGLGYGFRYRSPTSPETSDRGEVVAWMRLGSAVSGRRISTVTQLFKQSVLSQYQQLYGEPPRVLHGHGFRNKGYEIARYLALPDVGYSRSKGRIHGIALWMPPTSCPMERERSRNAAFAVKQLTGAAIDVSVEPHPEPHSKHDRPIAANSWKWLRISEEWVTAFPAIHERRRATDLNEVSQWCRHAGLPEPSDIRSSRTPLISGAIDLAPVEVNRPNRPALPYSHIWMRFAQPICGPVVVGSGRQRGFGLCIPQNRD